jgi:hypothetical protein
MVVSGLVLLVIGVLSFLQHDKVSSDSVRQVRVADTPQDSGTDRPQATLADVAAYVAALFRVDVTSSDLTPIDDHGIDDHGSAEATETACEPPMAVNEAPTDPQIGAKAPMPAAGAPAAAVPETPLQPAPPIQTGKDVATPAMPKPVDGGGDFGTALTFARSPAEAAKLAKRDKKLAFFLHVSGNFEDSGFT